MRKHVIAIVGGLVFSVSSAGCSAGKTTESAGGGTHDGSVGAEDAGRDATLVDAAGVDVGATTDAPGTPVDATGDDSGGLVLDGGAPCSGTHCSADLKSTLDCSDKVVTTCAAGTQCLGGTCVADACLSAADNHSSVGCEYFAVDPDVIGGLGVGGGTGACFAVYIANTWTAPVTVKVEYAGTVLDVTKFMYIPIGTGKSITFTALGGQLPVGAVAILFLADLPGASAGPGLQITCPASVTPAITKFDAAKHGTGYGNAFHIVASGPVAAYDIFPYGGGQSALTSANLLLPTSAWGDNYVAVTGYGAGLGGLGDSPFVEIVGVNDDTHVTINPTAAIAGGAGIAAGAKGKPTTYTVNKGQVLQFTQGAALDGSIIAADAPVGVWGGKTGLSITACCDDSAHQQIPPVRALGSEYVGVRYRNRYPGIEESPPWRMIGAANGITLTWEPSTPPGAPTTLSLGQLATFEASGPFVVRSQDANHPFYMSAHMTGGALYDPSQQPDAGSSALQDGRGDAEFVNMIPPNEFMTSYIFFTDPTYPETDLVMVRAKGATGFADVTLDCAGVLTGWQPIGTSGKYEYTRFDLVTGNFVGTGSCNNGRHSIKSDNPFGITVWGWGSAATGQMLGGFYSQYASYAYPGGASIAPINTVVIPTIQ